MSHSHPLLQALNEAQRSAVLHQHGPLMVIAGAGAGKTRTLTHRIAYLIARGVAPETILGITFTNKAAREMRERVRALLGTRNAPSEREPLLTTFHSLGARLAREYASHLGIPRSFAIYDRTDSLRLIKEALRTLGLERSYEPRSILSSISYAKGEGLSVGTYASRASSPREEVVARVWERYDEALRRAGALDFDDLLLAAHSLLMKDHIAAALQERWRYLHVDEFQDTNALQYELLLRLAGQTRNLCVVGDVDQNIYSWRGARMDFMLSFTRQFPDAHVVVLEENYRSSRTIVEAANSVIAHNRQRLPKRSVSCRDEGEPLVCYPAHDEHDEAAFVARTIAHLIEQGIPASDIAVLYRANFQSRVIEDALLRAGIPYQVVGTRFFERREIKDALAYLRAAVTRSSTADLARIANVPPRGIGRATLAALLAGRTEHLNARSRRAVGAFTNLLDRIAAVVHTQPASRAVRFALEETGYLAMWTQSNRPEDRERAQNLRELVSLATEFDALAPPEGIAHLLERAALETYEESPSGAGGGSWLMTVHAAKGLEFSHVIITGLEEGLFPSRMGTTTTRDEEEERRLFYVALTRAKDRVWLSWAASRLTYGSRVATTPSSFLSEIDPQYLEVREHTAPQEPTRVIYLD